MKKHTFSKRIIAVICAIVMAASGFMLPSFVQKTKAQEPEFSEITFSDYVRYNPTTQAPEGAVQDGLYVGGDYIIGTISEKHTTLDGVAFNGIVKFTDDVAANPQNTSIRIGGPNQWNQWPGIGIYYNQGIVLYNFTTVGYGELCHVPETDPVTFKNKEMILRLEFQVENQTDLRITFSIDGTEYYNDVIVGLAGVLGHGILVYGEGAGIELKSYLPGQEPKFTELTFDDYGVSDNTYTVGNHLPVATKKVTNLSNVAFTGAMTFTGSESQAELNCLRIGGLNQYNTWAGIGVYYDNGIVLWDYTGATTTNGGLLYHLVDSESASYKDQKVMVRLTFEYINDNQDVRLGLWVNGTQYFYKTVLGLAEKLGPGLLVNASSAPVAVESYVLQTMPSAELKDITLEDFDIAEDASVGTDGLYGSYKSGSLDGTRFSTYITLPERVGGSYLRFGGTEASGGWNGFSIKSWKDNTTELELSDQSGNTGYLSYCSTDVAGSKLIGQQIKLTITTEFFDADRDGKENDVMYGIYFNDALYNNQPVVLKDHVDYVGGAILFYTDNAGYPIELKQAKQLTLDDLGFLSGKFDNSYYVEEQYEGSLMNTVLTQKVTFSNHAGTQMNYAGSYSWAGIRFVTQADGTIVIRNAGGEFTYEYTLSPDITKTQLLGKELDLKLELYQTGADARLAVYINGKLYNNQSFLLNGAADKFGGYFGYAVVDEKGYVELKTQIGHESYNLANGPYLVSGIGWLNGTGVLTVNGTAPGWTITIPGDYTINSTGDGSYRKRVILYYYGDAHPDGEMDVRDLVATKKALHQVSLSSYAAKKGADANGDGTINTADLSSIQETLIGTGTLQNIKDRVISYEENVMPIAGYSGPRRTSDKNGKTYDYMNDETYQLIKDMGINLISYTTSQYLTDEEKKAEILEGLAFAEKYGLGVYVRDGRLGSKDNTPDWKLSQFISVFAQYSSFKGFAVIDEPYTEYYGNKYWVQSGTAKLEDYDEISSNVNGYTNLIGYVNLNPMRESLGGDDYREDYERYLEDYIEMYDARVLSFDCYPFDADTTFASYFDTLSVIRTNAIEHNLPFWTHIQAGTNWNGNVNNGIAATVNNTPTEGELLWNVNTSLAYGATGIQYFPLIQPPFFAYTKGTFSWSPITYDFERNGLIGANGVANKWYYYAQKANRQIAAVDEVLMNAESLDILAVGTTAQSDTGITKTTYKGLASQNAINASNGAIVGVFDYWGKTAFYVVNYDTQNLQDITLNFDGTKEYSIISATQETKITGQTCALNLEAGGAALVVVE